MFRYRTSLALTQFEQLEFQSSLHHGEIAMTDYIDEPAESLGIALQYSFMLDPGVGEYRHQDLAQCYGIGRRNNPNLMSIRGRPKRSFVSSSIC